MVNEYLDGHTDGMRDIGGNFSPPPVSFTSLVLRNTQACSGPGMKECGKLSEASQAAMEAIQTMTTHILQGFEAYKAMILSAADCYADHDGMGAIEFANIMNRPEQNLPEKAPIFLAPSPATAE